MSAAVEGRNALFRLDDALDIVLQPQRAFHRVATRPRVLPMLCFVLLANLIMYVSLRPVFIDRVEEALARTDVSATPRLVGIVLTLGGILGAVQVVFSLVVLSLIVHALAAWSGGRASRRATTAVVAIAAIPSGLRALVLAAMVPIVGADRVPLGRATLLGDDPNFLAVLDPFAIWSAVLIGVGLATVHHLSPGRASLIAAVVLVGGAIGEVLPALFA